MLAVVQRVSEASVEVEGVGVTGTIDQGLCVLLGVVEGDTEEIVEPVKIERDAVETEDEPEPPEPFEYHE